MSAPGNQAADMPSGASPRVVVASTAAMKVGSVRRMLEEVSFTSTDNAVAVEGVKAPSGINEQPFGHEETILGAQNRLRNAQKLAPGAAFYVAIENGIFDVKMPDKQRYFDLAWIVIAEGDSDTGHVGWAHSVGLEFPAQFVEAARAEGFDKTHAGHKMAASLAGMDPQDPHILLSGGAARREDLLLGGLKAAWGQLMRAKSQATTD
eukprot:TRINITY_DN36465_c0_g1_i1.p1 TRINITY_DN36465_c0_g1~~TRINITY_DN36465_c0_g1_i1.p1  ORF type:complete len:207 (-),score=45.07 TRINITY_DN36465_c0_g1_i1:282-902(-)